MPYSLMTHFTVSMTRFSVGLDFRAIVLLDSPPPVSLVGPAIEVQGEEIRRGMVDVVVADLGRARGTSARHARRNAGRHRAAAFDAVASGAGPGTCELRFLVSPLFLGSVLKCLELAAGELLIPSLSREAKSLLPPPVAVVVARISAKRCSKYRCGKPISCGSSWSFEC